MIDSGGVLKKWVVTFFGTSLLRSAWKRLAYFQGGRALPMYGARAMERPITSTFPWRVPVVASRNVLVFSWFSGWVSIFNPEVKLTFSS